MRIHFFIPLLSLFLIVISVNPFIEDLMYSSAITYMLSHYSLFCSGILISYYVIRREIFIRSASVITGVAIAFIWHYPYFFNIGAEFLWVRVVEESSLFFGGFLIGSSLRNLGNTTKFILLVLWMIGDSVLSLILMISPSLYTSYYSPRQLEYLGIIMFLLMTFIAVFVLLSFINSMLEEEKEKDIVYPTVKRRAENFTFRK